MTDDEIRIAIALEHTGIDWVFLQCWCIKADGKLIAKPSGPLDYPCDLNACHEFEKGLTDSEWQDYKNFLWQLFVRLSADNQWRGELYGDDVAHATARQRCEAFLRVKGLWTDTKPGGAS